METYYSKLIIDHYREHGKLPYGTRTSLEFERWYTNVRADVLELLTSVQWYKMRDVLDETGHPGTRKSEQEIREYVLNWREQVLDLFADDPRFFQLRFKLKLEQADGIQSTDTD